MHSCTDGWPRTKWPTRRLGGGPDPGGRARHQRRGGERDLRRARDSDGLEGILAYSDEPLASADIVGSPDSSIFDSGFTSVTDETSVKVLAWYDNESGYANRLVELVGRVMAPVPAGA